MKGQIVGYKNFVSKRGHKLTLAYIAQPFSQKEMEGGASGLKVVEIFLPDSQVGTLTSKDVSKECELEYEVSGGRAFLVSLRVL